MANAVSNSEVEDAGDDDPAHAKRPPSLTSPPRFSAALFLQIAASIVAWRVAACPGQARASGGFTTH